MVARRRLACMLSHASAERSNPLSSNLGCDAAFGTACPFVAPATDETVPFKRSLSRKRPRSGGRIERVRNPVPNETGIGDPCAFVAWPADLPASTFKRKRHFAALSPPAIHIARKRSPKSGLLAPLRKPGQQGFVYRQFPF